MLAKKPKPKPTPKKRTNTGGNSDIFKVYGKSRAYFELPEQYKNYKYYNDNIMSYDSKIEDYITHKFNQAKSADEKKTEHSIHPNYDFTNMPTDDILKNCLI